MHSANTINKEMYKKICYDFIYLDYKKFRSEYDKKIIDFPCSSSDAYKTK